MSGGKKGVSGKSVCGASTDAWMKECAWVYVSVYMGIVVTKGPACAINV